MIWCSVNAALPPCQAFAVAYRLRVPSSIAQVSTSGGWEYSSPPARPVAAQDQHSLEQHLQKKEKLSAKQGKYTKGNIGKKKFTKKECKAITIKPHKNSRKKSAKPLRLNLTKTHERHPIGFNLVQN